MKTSSSLIATIYCISLLELLLELTMSCLGDWQPDVDRVAMVGISYGAGLALLGADRDQRIKAVVAMSGWTEFINALFKGGKIWQNSKTCKNGHISKDIKGCTRCLRVKASPVQPVKVQWIRQKWCFAKSQNIQTNLLFRFPKPCLGHLARVGKPRRWELGCTDKSA